MNPSQQAQARTRMFARVLGPFLVVVTATALAQASQMRTLLSEFGASPVWPWVTGAFVVLSGLVVIALHQYWRGTAAIIVSVLGWLTALKGLALMAFAQTYISFAKSAVEASGWRIGFIGLGLVGLYLTYVGWTPHQIRPTAQPLASSNPDLPHAA
jgi:hypothetical protein